MGQIQAKETALDDNGQVTADAALQKSKSDDDVKGIGNKAAMPTPYAEVQSLNKSNQNIDIADPGIGTHEEGTDPDKKKSAPANKASSE